MIFHCCDTSIHTAFTCIWHALSWYMLYSSYWFTTQQIKRGSERSQIRMRLRVLAWLWLLTNAYKGKHGHFATANDIAKHATMICVAELPKEQNSVLLKPCKCSCLPTRVHAMLSFSHLHHQCIVTPAMRALLWLIIIRSIKGEEKQGILQIQSTETQPGTFVLSTMSNTGSKCCTWRALTHKFIPHGHALQNPPS